MTGDELFDRMQNKEFGVILESMDDARELQSILKSATRGIANVDDIQSWVTDHNAKMVVADRYRRQVLYAQHVDFCGWETYYNNAIPFSQIVGNHLSISTIDDLL